MRHYIWNQHWLAITYIEIDTQNDWNGWKTYGQCSNRLIHFSGWLWEIIYLYSHWTLTILLFTSFREHLNVFTIWDSYFVTNAFSLSLCLVECRFLIRWCVISDVFIISRQKSICKIRIGLAHCAFRISIAVLEINCKELKHLGHFQVRKMVLLVRQKDMYPW